MRAHDAMSGAVKQLQEAGIESPAVDARLLLTHVLGGTQGLLMASDPTKEQIRLFQDMIERRIAGEPVQHITGLAPFRYEELHVGPGVFIPRPETELLVDAALKVLAARPVGRRRVVELCAGSGAITLSIAREMGGVELHAVELSHDAWPWLQRNVAGVDAELVHGDMADAFPELDGTVDLVVVNPPYVPETDRALLPADVVGFDPGEALFSGPDGLDALRVVHAVAMRLLRPGGVVLAEHDETQSQELLQLFSAPQFEGVKDFPDLNGRPRFLLAELSPGARGPDVAGLAP